MKEEKDKLLEITLYSGMLAGILGKIICHPIDTIRAKIQIRQTQVLKLKAEHLIQDICMNCLYEQFGRLLRMKELKDYSKEQEQLLQHYYNFQCGTGPAYSLYLTTFEYTRTQLNLHPNFQKYSFLVSFISGMMAETISCIFWLPIDVIKERMQVQSNLKLFDYKNTFDAIRKILATEGIVGLYRAYGATIASFGPFSAFYFMFYEEFKTYLADPKRPSFLQSLCLSGLAGSIAGFICNPLDIVKLRMQVQRASNANHSNEGNFGYKNLAHGLYTIVQNEGIRSLTKGSLVKVIYACPNTAISMSVAEVTRNYLMNTYNVNHN